MEKVKEHLEHWLSLDHDSKYQIETVKTDTAVFSKGRRIEKLDGLWNFTVDVYDKGIRDKFFNENRKNSDGKDIPVDFDFDEWEKTKVPSNWNLEKREYFYYEGGAWYTRKFNFYKQNKDERVFMKIGAVNYEARIWLNKHYIARHIGGYTPFYIDITEYLQDDNRLMIYVNNTRKYEGIPSLNTDWFNYGGIYRSVELIRVPKNFIKDFFAHLVPDGTFSKIVVKVNLSGKLDYETCTVRIPDLGIEKTVEVDLSGKGAIVINASPELWCPENPKLYEVQVQYGEDIVKDYIGFREISCKGNSIYLNGRELFLKGICCHEESVVHGKALTEEELLESIVEAKELNCNVMRLAHYPHTERMSELADRLGIMLWEEIPVYWGLDFANKETYENAENQMKELIIRDRNRASVIIWSVGNENPDIDSRLEFMKNLVKVTKELDPSRLVSAACLIDGEVLAIKDRLLEHLDIVAINEYYGWYDRDFTKLETILRNSNVGKPVVISEVGACALHEHHGTIDDLFTEECQEYIYERQIEIIDKAAYIKGVFPWLLYDFRTPIRLNKYQKGYNRKGLLCPEKKHKKLAYYKLRNWYLNK